MADDVSFASARRHFLQALADLEAGRLEAAEAGFRASLALLPGRPSTLLNLGATLLARGRPEEALPVLGQVLALEPDDADALGHRSHALNLLGRHDQALPDLERFVALRPERPEGWFQHATTLQRLSRNAEALASYDRTIALMPAHAQAWSNRGGALKDLGRRDEAAASFERAIALGADAALNRYYLASVRAGADAPANAPRAFVRNLFDSYAEGFEHHLVQTLQYRAPQRLAAMIEASGRAAFRSALDLGCGTGLCGPLLRARCGRLEGVDLSPPMLAAAGRRGVYDELVEADIAEHLAATATRHDLLVAADVFIYVGALDATFAGAARVLEAGGLFAFSVEPAPEEAAFVLLESMRYAHSESYLRRLAGAHGLEVVALERSPIRRDGDGEVAGLYLLLRRA